jgi:hypothetical protein
VLTSKIKNDIRHFLFLSGLPVRKNFRFFLTGCPSAVCGQRAGHDRASSAELANTALDKAIALWYNGA